MKRRSHVTSRSPIRSYRWRQEERHVQMGTRYGSGCHRPGRRGRARRTGGCTVSDQPPAVSVYTLTPERIAATVAAVVALIGAVIGGLALIRSGSRRRGPSWPW